MMQIKEFLNYIKSERRYSTHTSTSYNIDLTQFQHFLKSNYHVFLDNEISFQMIRGWIAFLLESEKSVTTVNRKISTLRSYFKYLMSSEVIKKNPMTKIMFQMKIFACL